MENNNEITTGHITLGIFLVVLLTAGYLIADKLILSEKGLSQEEIKEKIENIEKTITPYDEKDALKEVVLVKDFSNTAKNGKQTSDKQVLVSVDGNIARGYLFVRASVNNKVLDEYSDAYVKLVATLDGSLQSSGGHLIENRSLDTPNNDTYTDLLYSLSDIKYKRSYNDSDLEVTSGNWLLLLNNGVKRSIFAFSSSEGNATLLKVSIFYECVEGTTCKIYTQ